MGTTLYLDCSSGVSGDMLVAALLDLGADRVALDRALASLPLDGFAVRVSQVEKGGLHACDFDVALDEAHENHDHDMAWLFGHERGHGAAGAAGSGCDAGGVGHAHEHEHAHEHGEAEGDGHEHACGEAAGGHGHAHHHEHRTLADVRAVLDAGDLTPRARAIAERTFQILAQAEAVAHGTTAEKVHFHEVGAVDSIVDVVAAAVCLDNLDATEVVVTELAEGCGTIRCAHGIMPVPVPAVCAVAAAHGLPLHATGVRGELVTPTGAALVAAVRTAGRLPERYVIERVGVGAGKRSYEGCSGILRALVVHAVEDGAPSRDEVVELVCDIDDSTGEALGHVLERLMAAGAREAHYLPVFTKKGRPAYQLQIVCTEDVRPMLERIVFEDTTAIGIRRARMERTVLPRRPVELSTALGTMRGKLVELPGGAVRIYPEHDSVAAAARTAGVPYQEAYRACLAACGEIGALPGEGQPVAGNV